MNRSLAFAVPLAILASNGAACTTTVEPISGSKTALNAQGGPPSDASPQADAGSASNAGCPPSDAGCEQRLDEGGVSTPQCTCAAMTALVKSEAQPDGSCATAVLLVESTTSDDINPNYDLGLPAGTPVCFVAKSGEFFQTLLPPTAVSEPPPAPYAFAIYTDSPWRVVEDGRSSTLPTPGSE